MDLEAVRAALRSEDEETRRAAVASVGPAAGEPQAALALLVEAMGDESWRVRKEAAARAASWADRPEAAAALVGALAEPENVGRRNAVIEALVQLGSAAVAPLTAALDGRPEHRKVIADTLGLIADPAGAAALEPLLGDPDPNVRVAAAESLGLIGGARAQAALRGVLGRGEALLKLAALDGLNRSGARLRVEELRPLAAEPTLKAAVLEALARTGEVAALDLIAGAVGDVARSVREAGICALAELHARLDQAGRALLAHALPPGAQPALTQALLEGTLGVQRAAARMLGVIGQREAVRPLALLLGEPELRDEVTAALQAIGPAAVDALVELAPDLEGRLRAEVYALLPGLGPAAADPRVCAILGEALEDEDEQAASQAARALGEIGGRAALGPLARALEREDVASAAAEALGRLGVSHYDEVRLLVQSRGLGGHEAPHLCRVLGACGRAADVPLLKAALGAEAPPSRRAAADALSQLAHRLREQEPDTDTGELDAALVFALADESAEVRAAAARALGALARAGTPPIVVDSLARAAQDAEVAVRTQAARALGEVALRAAGERERALGELRRLGAGDEVAAAVPALEALGPAGAPEDEALLLRALAADDAEVVKAAARALGSRHTDPARGALAQALDDRRWDVRRAAAQALGEHGRAAHPLLHARRTVERDGLVLDAIDAALGRET